MAAVELSVGEVEKLEWLRGKERRVAAERDPWFVHRRTRRAYTEA